MSASATKSQLNRDTAGDNETLFDFLKRKKKYALESTVNKSLHHHSYTKKKIDLDVDDDFPQVKDERTRYTQYQSNNEANRGTRQHITPKKIQFQEEPRKNRSIVKQTAQPAQQNQGRSFLSMISPLKPRPASALEERYQEKDNAPKSGRKSAKGNESYSKKNVTKSINSIKEAMHILSDTIRSLKDKSHGLLLHFNPLFNFVSEANTPIAKQVGDFRNKLKAFQSLISSTDTENIDEIVERFHKNLEEHLQFEEGHLRKALQRAKQDEVEGFKTERDRQISRLQAENKKLGKEVDLLQRRLQKAESSHGNLAEAISEREMNSVYQLERIKQSYEATIEQLKTKNEELVDRCNQLYEENKLIEKERKDERFWKEGLEERTREQIQKIIQAKDAYLINEIMVLKAEFSAEIARVNELHKVKEAQLLNRIVIKEEELNKKAFERGCDRQIETKIMEEASIVKQENLQLKAKTQCIITDMYRMNEQLYQHWMALKDIKALSNRLGSFSQYRKIYEDLAFNDHLFH